jgi:UDP-N-acetylglucosamine transferase subunit ALG13
MIFVSVGTNEARFDRLLRAVADLPAEEERLVQHGHSTPFPGVGVELVDFLSFDEMAAAIRRARAFVTHAGVGSVLVALANGKRAVVVPRRKAFGEAVDDHQLQLGRRFAAAGLVTLVEDHDGLEDALAAAEHDATVTPTAGALAADLRDYLTAAVGHAAVPARA